MLYLMILIFISSIVIILKEKGLTRYFLFLINLGWLLSLIGFISYLHILQQKNLYLFMLSHIFNQSGAFWGNIQDLGLDQNTAISLLNFGTVFFIYSCLCFSISFTRTTSAKKYIYLAAIIPVIEIVVFNPGVYAWFYKWFFKHRDIYSPVFDQFLNFEAKLYLVIHAINYLYLILSIGIIIYYYLKTAAMKYFKLYVLYILLGFSANILAFLSILWWAPRRLISVSVYTGITHILPVSLFVEGKMLFLLPYLSIIASAAMLLALYKYNKDYNQMKLKRELLVQSFDIAEFGARFFSHSIKNYIMATIIDAEFIKEKHADDPETSKYIQRILKINQELLGNLNNLNTKFKKVLLHIQPVNLKDILEDVLGRFNLDNIRLTLDLPPEPVIALVDITHISEVIGNIIQNGLESMVNLDDRDKSLSVKLEIKKNWAVIAITDNGCGIEPKDMENLFRPFYTTKSREKWGIGLTYCYKIITAHRGKIIVESKIRQGSTFKILLPDGTGR